MRWLLGGAHHRRRVARPTGSSSSCRWVCGLAGWPISLFTHPATWRAPAPLERTPLPARSTANPRQRPPPRVGVGNGSPRPHHLDSAPLPPPHAPLHGHASVLPAGANTVSLAHDLVAVLGFRSPTCKYRVSRLPFPGQLPTMIYLEPNRSAKTALDSPSLAACVHVLGAQFFTKTNTVESHCLRLLLNILGRNGSGNYYYWLKTDRLKK
jgi:hypothetical protein